MSFNCSVCGERHEAELRDTRFSLPDVVFELTTEERARRVWSADDWCVLDGESDEARRFVRGLLKLPLLEEEGYFGYGVWVEVAQSDFGVLVEHWFDPDCGQLPAFPGRLANELRPYRGTIGLDVELEMADPTLLPDVAFGVGPHEVIQAQRAGIDHARLLEVASAVSH